MRTTACLLGLVALTSSATAQSGTSAPDTIEGHLAAGKAAAGGRDNTPDFYGLVTATRPSRQAVVRIAKDKSAPF